MPSLEWVIGPGQAVWEIEGLVVFSGAQIISNSHLVARYPVLVHKWDSNLKSSTPQKTRS